MEPVRATAFRTSSRAALGPGDEDHIVSRGEGIMSLPGVALPSSLDEIGRPADSICVIVWLDHLADRLQVLQQGIRSTMLASAFTCRERPGNVTGEPE